MAFKAITFDETVLSGDKLQFKFKYVSRTFDLVYPSEQELLDAANQAASISVETVTYDTFSGAKFFGNSGIVSVTVTEATTPIAIADDLRQLFANFKTIQGIQITEVDKDSFSFKLSPSIPTTITAASIAIIAVVILVVVFKFT